MRIRSLILVGTISFISCLSNVADSAEYEARLEAAEVEVGYGERVYTALKFDTEFQAVSNVVVEISGLHTNGWCVPSGGLERPCGAGLSVHILRPGNSLYYHGLVRLTDDGPFTNTVSIPEGSWPVPDWAFLLDGEAEVMIYNNHHFFIGGGSTTEDPFVKISKLVVRVDAIPLVRLSLDEEKNELCWTELPAQGLLNIFAAPNSIGPWIHLESVDSESDFLSLEEEPFDQRFFKAILQSEPAQSDLAIPAAHQPVP